MLALTQYACLVVGLAAALGTSAEFSRRGWIKPPDQGRNTPIDGLRGFLALAVLFHHYFMWTTTFEGDRWLAPTLAVYNSLGEVGVSVFFMITGTLFYSRIAGDPVPGKWTKVFVSRAFRILPLAWAAILVVIAIAYARGAGLDGRPVADAVRPLLFWFSFLDMPDIADLKNTRRIVAGVLWSLRYEILFYLSLPVLSLCFRPLARRIDKLAILAVSLLLLLLAQTCFGRPSWLPKPVDLAFQVMPLFVIGMIGAELGKRRRISAWLRSRTAAWLGALSVSLVLFGSDGAYGAGPCVLIGLFFVPVACGNAYFGILACRACVALGELSYSIYLSHGIVLYLFMTSPIATRLDQQGALVLWLLSPFLIACVVCVSLSSYKLIELPFIRLGKRLAAGLDRRAGRSLILEVDHLDGPQPAAGHALRA